MEFYTLNVTGAAYWLDVIISLLVAFIPSVGTALLAAFFLDKAFKKSKNLGDSLVKSGIDHIEYVSGKMNKRDRSILFGLNHREKPIEVCLCFITGDNFFLDYYEYLLDLLDNQCKIKILLANPFDSKRYDEYLKKYPSKFDRDTSLCQKSDKEKLAALYYDYSAFDKDAHNKLSYLERTYLMVSKEVIERISEEKYRRPYSILEEHEKQNVWLDRISNTGDHVMQVALVTKIIESLNEKSTGTKIELAYYKDEYRIPIILSKYKKAYEIETLLWTNMNAPVKETTRSVNVFGKTNDNNDATYVTDVVKSFDYLFSRYYQ
jgi:hypothetical protein